MIFLRHLLVYGFDSWQFYSIPDRQLESYLKEQLKPGSFYNASSRRLADQEWVKFLDLLQNHNYENEKDEIAKQIKDNELYEKLKRAA